MFTRIVVLEGLRSKMFTRIVVLEGLRSKMFTRIVVLEGLRSKMFTRIVVLEGLRRWRIISTNKPNKPRDFFHRFYFMYTVESPVFSGHRFNADCCTWNG